MLQAFQVIQDFKVELLKNWIGKKVASIIMPPDTLFNPSKCKFSSRVVTISLYDCFKAGWAEFRFTDNGIINI